jgi:cystathionine beta-lyase family protein involved in aluminum resistance
MAQSPLQNLEEVKKSQSSANYIHPDDFFSKIQGPVLLMKSSKKVTRKYLDLQGADLICYKARNKREPIIFLHNLVGTFIEKLDPIEIADDLTIPIITEGD